MRATFVLAIVIVTVIAAALLVRHSEIRNTPDQVLRTESVVEMPATNLAQDAIDTATPAASDLQVEPTQPAVPIQPESVYDIAFGRPEPGNLLWEIHADFESQPRDESWASAMESGIRLHIVDSEATEWATVEEVECRASICEVRGFMPDAMEHPDLDPYELISGDFGTGWWQGGINVMTRQHTFNSEEITRFMLIMVRVDEEEWRTLE